MRLPAILRIGLAGAACLCATGALARADTEGGLRGRIGAAVVGRENLGALGEDYGNGLLFGIVAGLDQSLPDTPWSYGIESTTLIFGYYFATNDTLVNQTIKLTELNLGMRVRRGFGIPTRYITVSAGGAFSAFNIAIAPTNERRYLGVYGGMGYETPIVGAWSLAGEARYAHYVDGPQNVSVFVSFTTGI